MAIINDLRMFGDIFKELRLDKKLSQDQISKELDVSQTLIVKWENQQSTPSPEMLDYIADYFNVSTDYLIGRTNDKRFYAPNNKNNEIINEIYDKLQELPREKQEIILNITKSI